MKRLDADDIGIYQDLSVDIFQLEKEWIKQSTLCMQYMEKAIKIEDEKKNHLNKIGQYEAELDLKFREGFRLRQEKFTEKVIESKIKIDSKYNEMLEEQNILNYNYNYINACVRVMMDQKKATLENLVKLYLGGYFSEPSLKSRRGEEVSQKMRSKLNKEIKKLKKDV